MAHYEALDLQTVAELLGVSPRQVNNYINHKDLPSQGSGKRRTFVWADVLEWYVGYRAEMEMGGGNGGSDAADFDEETSGSGSAKKEDQRQANLRKTRAEANLKELALARQRGQVVVIADAKQRLDRMTGNMRARLLGLPPKLASRLEGLPSRTERESAIKDEMEALCREISTGAVVDLPKDAEPETDDTLELDASAERDLNAEILAEYEA